MCSEWIKDTQHCVVTASSSRDVCRSLTSNGKERDDCDSRSENSQAAAPAAFLRLAFGSRDLAPRSLALCFPCRRLSSIALSRGPDRPEMSTSEVADVGRLEQAVNGKSRPHIYHWMIADRSMKASKCRQCRKGCSACLPSSIST